MKKILIPVFGLAILACTASAQDDKAAAKGKEVFEQCSACHNADSDEKKMGPGLKGLYKKATFADGKTKVDDKSVAKKINEGGNGMPAYEEMLEKKDKEALLVYLKTL